MSIELCVLASGSAGNCSMARTPGGVVMIDAGIGPRIAASRMNGTGASMGDIVGLCLTHLDRDHFSPAWIRTLVTRQIRTFCDVRQVPTLLEIARRSLLDEDDGAGLLSAFEQLAEPFEAEAFSPTTGVSIRGVRLAHDRAGSNAFIVESDGQRLGYATDLGRVPEMLIEQLCGVDILAIESNYDPEMQRQSGRPWFLQERIMSGRGHLSNQEAFDAVRRVFQLCGHSPGRLPAHVALLHRSRQCNCPRLVRRLFERDPRIGARLTLTEQYSRSEWLRPRAHTPPAFGEQLVLGWG